MSRTIKVQQDAVSQDGDSYTITLPDSVVTEEEVTANFVPKDVHQQHVDGVDARIASAQQTARKDERKKAVKDDAFLEETISARPDFFKTRFPEAADPTQIQQQVRDEELTPVITERDEALQVIKDMRQDACADAVDVALAKAGVTDDSWELMKAYLEKGLVYSPEFRQPVIMGEDGKPLTKLDEGKVRPITVTERAMDLKASGKHEGAFKANVPGGVGVDEVDGGTLENIDAKIAAAEKKGDFQAANILKTRKLTGGAST